MRHPTNHHPHLRPRPRPAIPGTTAERDRGAILPLVLVMVVVVAVWTVPLLGYASSVLRANEALSGKTQRIEAVKAGLRVALADPAALYDHCGVPGGAMLAPSVTNGVAVDTRCGAIEVAYAQSENERRIGIVATQVGETFGEELTGSRFTPVTASPTEWFSDASLTSETDRVWLPELPVRAPDLRNSTGHAMPTADGECTVYFPGSYPDPLLLDGPTFFTSGVYYFEGEISIVGGADVVVGAGATLGCASDQEAAFYATNAPATHNINGLGATWILGRDGRVSVTDSDTDSVQLSFNRRYVADEDVDTLPSADVSIITVNGALAEDQLTGTDLVVPDSLTVPLSVVGGAEPTDALSQGYAPSLLTPVAREPEPVANVTAVAAAGAVVVSWDPSPTGGDVGYTATAATGESCSTNGATTCAITGLANEVPVGLTVTATNDLGESVAVPVGVAPTPSATAPALTAPAAPSPPTATPYEGAAHVTWLAPTDGGAPITSYTVTAAPVGAVCVADMTTAGSTTECVVTGLDPAEAAGYTFSVIAENAIGASLPSAPSTPPVVAAVGLGNPPPTPPPAGARAIAVVDISLAGTAESNVTIPGYVAVPQGRFRVDNPAGQPISITGGLLAAQIDIDDARAAGPESVDIGLRTLVVQRRIRIVSSTSGGPETSIAIVQVNQNGAYAINSWQVQ